MSLGLPRALFHVRLGPKGSQTHRPIVRHSPIRFQATIYDVPLLAVPTGTDNLVTLPSTPLDPLHPSSLCLRLNHALNNTLTLTLLQSPTSLHGPCSIDTQPYPR